MSFVNQYRSTTIYGELKVQKYNTGNIAGLLDISGNTILRGDCIINGNLSATDGTIDISGNLNVSDTISGKLAINDTNNTNDFFRVPFLDSQSSSSTLSSSAGLQFNPVSEYVNYTTLDGGDIYALDISCNNVNAANFIGNISTTTEDTTNASFFPTFVSAEGNAPLKVNSGFTYNPVSETLSVTNINGTIMNNSTTSTITTDSSNQSFYPTFVSNTTGNLPLKVDSGITYNPSSNILSCNVSGNLSGTATTSTNSTITTDSSNQSFYPTFVSATSGNLPLKVDSGISYNPSSNLLGTTVTNVNVTNTITGTFRVPFALTATGSAALGSHTDLTYDTNFQILNATVSKVYISNSSSNTAFRIPLVSGTGTGAEELLSNSTLTFNPSSSTLSVGRLSATSLNVGSGIWLVGGSNTGTIDFIVPVFKSQSSLTDLNDQGSLTYTRQNTSVGTTAQQGVFQNPIDVGDKVDRVIVFPRWGIIGYRDGGFAAPVQLNFKNLYNFPVTIVPAGDANQLSSIKVYFNDVEQT